MCISIKNIGHVVLNVYICTYGFEIKIGVFMPLNLDFVQGNLVNGKIKQECIF